MSGCYYNDNEPFVCAWLRNLIAAGLIPAGEVDERPIQEVQPDDVRGFTQCHFFAGIGGWAYALQLAGWGDRPVWTGSCPCQPFSTAGKGKAEDDPRHLWPCWFRLIRECHPERIFGEQVAAAIGHGWLDVVATELEAEGYAVGTSVLGAHSVGAPHLRQRLWFVADADCDRWVPWWTKLKGQGRGTTSNCTSAGSVADAASNQARTTRFAWQPWDAPTWLPCTDGKARPVEPGTFPLAHGIPARVGRLRAYGNAIVPQVAAAFVSAYMEVIAAPPGGMA